MFKKLILRHNIKILRSYIDQMYEGENLCKSCLYEIEHEKLEDFHIDSILKTYGSIENYKKDMEEKLDKFKSTRKELIERVTKMEMGEAV